MQEHKFQFQSFHAALLHKHIAPPRIYAEPKPTGQPHSSPESPFRGPNRGRPSSAFCLPVIFIMDLPIW